MEARHCWRTLFNQEPGSISVKRAFVIWNDVVQNYTGRHLSVAQDRLPAIAGPASFLKEKGPRDNAYIVGLWKASFVQEMAWICHRMPSDHLKGPLLVGASFIGEFWATPPERLARCITTSLIQLSVWSRWRIWKSRVSRDDAGREIGAGGIESNRNK